MSTELFASSAYPDESRGMFVTGHRPARRLHRRRSRHPAAHPAAARDSLQDGDPSQISRNIAEAISDARPDSGACRLDPLGDGEQTRAPSGIPISGTQPGSPRRCRARISSILNVISNARRDRRRRGRRGARLRRRRGAGHLPGRARSELPELTRRVTDALHKSLAFTDGINDERIGRGLEPIRYGIGLNPSVR